MTFQLNQQEFQRLVYIIQNLPEWGSSRDRRTLVQYTLEGNKRSNTILSRLDLDGSPFMTASQTVKILVDFGQITDGVEALGAFIDQLLKNIIGGGEDADFMADVISTYRLVSPPSVKLSIAPITSPSPVNSAKEKYIFISYARPEQAIAAEVETYLKSAGFQVFRDTQKIVIGDNWDMTIETALNEATHMVLLLSAASMPYRKEVHREWFYFDQKRKPILPLYVQNCVLHSRMVAYNYIDAQTNLEVALTKLLDALK